MFRQDRTNPSSAVSNWRGRHESSKGWPSTAVSSWLNGGLFGGGGELYNMYFVGGNNTVDGSANATGDKIGISSETATALAVGLAQGVSWTSGMNNNGVAGYTGGGYNSAGVGGEMKTASKMLYASDTVSTLTDVTNAGYGVGSCANSGVAGYVMGGSGASTRHIAQKILFSNDSWSVLAADPIFPTDGTVDSCYVGDMATMPVVSPTRRLLA